MQEQSIIFIISVASLIFLVSLFFVSAFTQAIRRMRKAVRNEALEKVSRSVYFKIHKKFTESKNLEALYFGISFVQQILRILFAFSSLYILAYYLLTIEDINPLISNARLCAEVTAGTLICVVVFTLFGDILPRAWSYSDAAMVLQIASPIVTFYFVVFFPITYIFYKILHYFFPKVLIPFSEQILASREKLLELIADIDDGSHLTENDKKLLQSVLHYRDRIVREVMVPRVDLFCIPYDCSIIEAAKLLQKEGYSRVPVYRNSFDHIVGVLMYKDILAKYMEFAKTNNKSILTNSIEDITKQALYAPETKKISQLLQEFRKKQTHIAVVVDEYGGTAGIVTIEDILEEIVGEIADEYDEDEALYRPTDKSAWIIDAKMNLLDLEEDLGIKIPQEGDYDTIAGYVFYRLGSIPHKGTIIHHDNFILEILSSNDRTVELVKLTPRQHKQHNLHHEE